MKIGVYGGVFDPPHRGHQALAQAAVTEASLDRLYVVPTNHPPHKRTPATAFAHRVAMVLLAFPRENPFFFVSELEAEDRVHYSCDTLAEFARAHPGDELYFLIGSDSLQQLPSWRNWRSIPHLARLLVARRPGADPDDPRIPAELRARCLCLQTHRPLAVSSSQLREGLAGNAGKLWTMLTPAVAEYIRCHELYGVRDDVC